MGGNIVINDLKSVPLLSERRSVITKDVYELMTDLNNKYRLMYGEFLWEGDISSTATGIFSGSTAYLFDPSIETARLLWFKPTIGDIDLKVPKGHLHKLNTIFNYHPTIGSYYAMASRFGSGQLHMLMKHEQTGDVHQFDFEESMFFERKPTEFSKFAYSSAWEDTEINIKGADHKILMNSIGLDRYKFSIALGLGRRLGRPDWTTKLSLIAATLFEDSDRSTVNLMWSFRGLCNIISNRLPQEQCRRISLDFLKRTKASEVHKPAVNYLRIACQQDPLK